MQIQAHSLQNRLSKAKSEWNLLLYLPSRFREKRYSLFHLVLKQQQEENHVNERETYKISSRLWGDPLPILLIYKTTLFRVIKLTKLSLSLSQSVTHPPNHSLTHSLGRSLTHWPTHPLTHPLTPLLPYSLRHSLPHPLTHSLTHSFNYSPTHPLTYSLNWLIERSINQCKRLTYNFYFYCKTGISQGVLCGARVVTIVHFAGILAYVHWIHLRSLQDDLSIMTQSY